MAVIESNGGDQTHCIHHPMVVVEFNGDQIHFGCHLMGPSEFD
jgi:hypothetical protein